MAGGARPEALIGHVPHTARDRSILRALSARDGRAAERLAALLCEDERRRDLPLRALLPGMETAGDPRPLRLADRLADHEIHRAGIASWPALAVMSPASLVASPAVAERSARLAVAGALCRWGEGHLGLTARAPTSTDGAPVRGAPSPSWLWRGGRCRPRRSSRGSAGGRRAASMVI